MSESNNRLKEISDKMSEHIIAVKGTLELLDASVSEDDLHSLILKAVERMENMQRLSDELLAVLKQVFEKMSEAKDRKEP
jgi:DNA-binding FrmR family transcriptional regulator